MVLEAMRKYFGFEMEWKPNSQISFSIGPEYSTNFTLFQWVGNFSDPIALSTYNTRYVFADLNQETISSNIRLNWIFTPTLSLQLYLQPLFSVGNYENFKEIINPPTLDVATYGSEGTTISYNDEQMLYTVDPDAEGPAEQFSFNNPDFNFKSFTWKCGFKVGSSSWFSILFCMDKQQKNFDDPGELNFKNDFRNLVATEADNVFLVKFSYWIDM